MAKLWFTARRYGWGWQPASIEGWLVMLAFIVGVLVDAYFFVARVQTGNEVGAAVICFLLWIAVLVAALIAIAWRTGERPRWRWGN